MSDFLSKFSGNHYEDLLEEDKKRKVLQKENPESVTHETGNVFEKLPLSEQKQIDGDVFQSVARSSEKSRGGTEVFSKVSEVKQKQIDHFFAHQEEGERERPSLRRQGREEVITRRRDESHEETEVDPDYQKTKRRKFILIGVSIISCLALGLFLFYQFTHVTVPNFIGKTVTEAREWGNEYGVEIELTQEHSIKYDENIIVSQKVKEGQKVAKGSKLSVVGSLGANPKEILSLPDFSKMTYVDAQKWIEENKAKNLNLIQIYSDTTAKGRFIKLEIANSIPSSDYTRGDKATLTYSRGKEVLEANIEVPDFVGKTKTDVDSWAKTNSIEVTYEEKASSNLAAGTIMGQSVAATQKVAKKSKIIMQVSAGKGIMVPDFSTLTMTQAASVAGLTVIVRQVYGNSPYGALISQSKEAGTELTEKDDKNVEVVYSAGAPYIRDLSGKNEGELQQYFYDEFRSKGAEIYFTSYYVNSDQPKGTVVAQNAKETWLPLAYTVEVGISNGAYFSGTIVPPANTTPEGSTASPEGTGAKE
ncbi:PASTA domain-containing protein [Streptococcus sp. S784/96/1]|uniref:PASTA domain-containing protein n=1 Tax=Streptococcus sp. S784/96/1 TaxID=2653499 RepID=UPI001386A383|nr:PASTA domain-containing protein [Streptococcus sp. S784/96/1]